GIAVLEVIVSENLVLALCFHGKALLAREIGELGVDVELGRVELVDLLVDRDRFEEEAVARVVIGDSGEDLDRLVVAIDAHPEIADAIQSIDITGVIVEKALVLLDRRLDLPLRNQLLSAGDDLIALDRHRLRSARTATSARPPLRTICGESAKGRRASAPPDATPSRTPDYVENR